MTSPYALVLTFPLADMPFWFTSNENDTILPLTFPLIKCPFWFTPYRSVAAGSLTNSVRNNVRNYDLTRPIRPTPPLSPQMGGGGFGTPPDWVS
jgi:hypothetical protein